MVNTISLFLLCPFYAWVVSPSSGIRAGFLECVDRASTVRQFAPGLCGCGSELRRCLHKESVVEGLELLILRRLEPSKGRYKHCRRSSIEEQMLSQVTTVRMTMKKKLWDQKGNLMGNF